MKKIYVYFGSLGCDGYKRAVGSDFDHLVKFAKRNYKRDQASWWRVYDASNGYYLEGGVRI